MPIYEYRCQKCGSLSAYLEKRGARHLLKPKCKTCGSRRTRKVPSTFLSTVKRTQTETLNELKHVGPVLSAPRAASSQGAGRHSSVCPFCQPAKEVRSREAEGADS